MYALVQPCAVPATCMALPLGQCRVEHTEQECQEIDLRHLILLVRLDNSLWFTHDGAQQDNGLLCALCWKKCCKALRSHSKSRITSSVGNAASTRPTDAGQISRVRRVRFEYARQSAVGNPFAAWLCRFIILHDPQMQKIPHLSTCCFSLGYEVMYRHWGFDDPPHAMPRGPTAKTHARDITTMSPAFLGATFRRRSPSRFMLPNIPIVT